MQIFQTPNVFYKQSIFLKVNWNHAFNNIIPLHKQSLILTISLSSTRAITHLIRLRTFQPHQYPLSLAEQELPRLLAPEFALCSFSYFFLPST
jgi:hypothetical protein